MQNPTVGSWGGGHSEFSLYLVEVITRRGTSKKKRRLAIFILPIFCSIESPLPPLLGEKAGMYHRCLLQVALTAGREQRGTHINSFHWETALEALECKHWKHCSRVVSS